MPGQAWYKVFGRNEGAEKGEKTADRSSFATYRGARLDNPIRRGEDDTLGRGELVSSFVKHTLSLDPEQGVVVGIIGPWGSGKTSFINLVRNDLKRRDIAVLDFNPWMFSGTEQLLEAFFNELAAQIRLKPELASLADRLEDYGDVFSKLGWLLGPLAGLGKPLTGIIGKILKAKQQGVGHHRARLEGALRALKNPIIVVLDDIDRLNRTEIRDIFKLVRLTANFPNVIYVVALDRLRVERALSDEDLPGRDYLEKILQVTLDLPPIPHEVLGRQALNAIEEALTDVDNTGPFNSDLWPDVFAEIVRPLIQTPRDVRRYAVALRSTVLTLNGQIELTDVFGLEAIRTFLPDVFERMHGAVAGLTTTADTARHEDARSKLKGNVENLLESSGERRGVLRAMIIRLFPAARWHIENCHFGNDFKRTWLRERRVAHEDVLRLYLERTPTGAFTAFTDAEKAFGLMSNREEFATFLSSLDAQCLQDVIASLETFEEKFTPNMVVPGTIALMNLLSELPERKRGMFELNADLVVARVVLRLLRSLSDRPQIEGAVSAALPQITSLRGKLRVIDIVGYRENAGHKLVSPEAAARFAHDWRSSVRSSSPDTLLKESDLLFTLFWARKDLEPNEAPIIVPDSPAITSVLLREARTEAISNSLGSRAIQRHPYLQWDALIGVFGEEEILQARLDGLRTSGLTLDDDLMELADKYAAGWRPDQFVHGA